ncbi:MAG: TIR domain-containing protein [Phototrophicaceae bacterium]
MATSEFSDVFVSYRRMDVEFVKQLVEALRQAGKEVWIDWEDIPPGSVEFTNDIRQGLEGADAFIAVVSPNYLESTYCLDMELAYAASIHKKLIPIIYQPFDVSKTPPSISHINWIYFIPHAGQDNTFEESFPKVLNALEADYAHAQTHRRLFVRAQEWQEHDRMQSYLLDGDEITKAEQWLVEGNTKNPEPTNLHVEYIQASRALATHRQRQVLFAVSCVLVISLCLTVLSAFSFYRARQAQQEANANYVLAVTAQQVAVQENATAVVALEQAQINEERAIHAESTAVARAQEADARALAERLQGIAHSDPFLAYGLGLALLEVENLPTSVHAKILELFINSSATSSYQHSSYLTNVVYRPTGDYALATAEDTLLQWDLNNPEATIVETFSNEIITIAFDPSGSHYALSDWDGNVYLYEAQAHELILMFTLPQDDVSSKLLFSNDGRSLFIGSWNWGVVYQFDIASKQPIQIFPHENTTATISVLDQSPDGNFLITGDTGGRVYEWSLADATVQHVLSVGGEELKALSYTPSGKNIFVGVDQNLVLFELATGDVLDTFEEHSNAISNIVMLPDGVHALVSSFDHMLSMWNIQERFLVRSFEGHAGTVWDIDISADGRYALSASDDGRLIKWDLVSVPYERLDTGIAADFSPDGKSLVIGDLDRLYTYSLETHEIISELASGDLFTIVKYSPNGEWIATANDDAQSLEIWEVASGERVFNSHLPRGSTYDMAFSKNGDYLLASSPESGVVVWETQGWEQRKDLRFDPEAFVFGLSTDQTRLALESAEGSIDLYDFNTGTFDTRLADRVQSIWSMNYSPNDQYLASGLSSGQVVIWDVEQRLSSFILSAHQGEVSQVIFTPDSRKIVSASWDESMILWDALTGEKLRHLLGHQDKISSLAMSRDGEQIVTAGFDGTVYLWDLWLTADEIRQWATENRTIVYPTCEQLLFYKIVYSC